MKKYILIAASLLFLGSTLFAQDNKLEVKTNGKKQIEVKDRPAKHKTLEVNENANPNIGVVDKKPDNTSDKTEIKIKKPHKNAHKKIEIKKED